MVRLRSTIGMFVLAAMMFAGAGIGVSAGAVNICCNPAGHAGDGFHGACHRCGDGHRVDAGACWASCIVTAMVPKASGAIVVSCRDGFVSESRVAAVGVVVAPERSPPRSSIPA